MTTRLEFHAGDGGADAHAFAGELADAVSKHSSRPVRAEGRVLVVDGL
jgi:protein subunit release factor A